MFIENTLEGKDVYRISGKNIAPVVVGVQAIAASRDTLYIAAESGSESRTTAVLQVELPKES